MTKTTTFLSLAILPLIYLATSIPLFFPGEGAAFSFLTPRGELAMFYGHGVYHYLPLAVAREGLIWDAINLFIGLPAFAVAVVLAYFGSFRARLVVTGLSLYFAYVYLTFAMMDLNPLFFCYVAIFALSLTTFCFCLAGIDLQQLTRHVSARFPRRFLAGFAFAQATALLFLWGFRVTAILRSGKFGPELAGLSTLQSQVMDLGLLVPLGIVTGILLVRKHPWGILLTAIDLIFGFMMFLTIPAWIAVPLIQDGKIALVEAIPFLLLCGVGLALVTLFFRNMKNGAIATNHPSAHAFSS